ncbi:MAG: HDOD domain-containing protein [Desulfobacterales bacterium]|nr:HDOD domain-containing protein [Desulfobacterales bacterium]
MPQNKNHIAAGSWHIGPQTALTLQAYLGTCVGVTIVDAQAQVGGLIHLLLPEPVSLGDQFQPQRYASSGLPLFIEALCQAGASKPNMQATIAGGALVGPLDERDLALNIGGRTTEVVEKTLNDAGIAIEKSETGGFFTCCLNLDMQTWQCAIEPAGFDKLEPAQTSPPPTPENIEQALQNLQPIPQVALKILQIIQQDEYDITQIAETVKKDQVISARTLQLCNSAMFARQIKIDSIDNALVRLGQDLLIKLIISAAIKNFFNQSGKGYSLCQGGIFHHSIGTAIVSEKIARLTGGVTPSLAYTAGLLHDIGKVVLDQFIASAYPLFYRSLHEEQHNFIEIERKELGRAHTTIGCELGQNWSFPDILIETIEHHHRPETSTINSALTHIVYLADLLMSRFHAGLEVERLNTEALNSRLAAIGLSSSQFVDIVDLIPSNVLTTADQPLPT